MVWPELPCDPPDRAFAREVHLWSRWALLPTGAVLGLGLLLVFLAALDPVSLSVALRGGEVPPPDVEAIRASAGWWWGTRMVGIGAPLVFLDLAVVLGSWWIDRLGGWGELQLRKRAREKAKSDEPWQVLQAMLELEAQGEGRRPEHVLMYAACLPNEAVDPELLEALRLEALEVRDHAVAAIREGDGLRIPDTLYAGRLYDPGELRVLAERAVEAIWECKLPRNPGLGPPA